MFFSGMVEIPRPFAMTQDMLQAKRGFVMPRKHVLSFIEGPASILVHFKSQIRRWIPAPDRVRGKLCAGMTDKKVDFESTLSESLGFEPRAVQL